MVRNPEDAFFLIGISHKTAPVEIRERISFDGDQLGDVISGVRAIEGISGCVVLSTCNRTELYAARTARNPDILRRTADHLAGIAGAGPELRSCFYIREGAAAVEHLFRVAGGLDSMILGEPQILGQVRTAYALACDRFATDTAINRLFHHAFRAGKRIRTRTSIGEGTVSVSHAAVELANQVFGDLAGRVALLVGAGKAGELCARRLVDSGVGKLLIANRTGGRAAGLAEQLTGESVPFESIAGLGASADIIITSAAAREPIIRREAFLPFLGERQGKPLLLIDLGVPRNIEPEMEEHECVRLYNIDDLETVTIENRDRRALEAERAEEFVRHETEDFRAHLAEREVAPVIRELRERCEAIRLGELSRVRGKIDGETLDLIDLVTRRIVRKILHNPTVAVRSSESGESRESLLRSVRELFIGDAATGKKTDTP